MVNSRAFRSLAFWLVRLRGIAFVSIVSTVGVCAMAAPSAADTIFALVNSADVYLIDSVSLAVIKTYTGVFTGSSGQCLAEDLVGNLYTMNASGALLTATTPYTTATTGARVAAAAQIDAAGGWTNPALTVTAAEPRLGYDTKTSKLVTTQQGACPASGSSQTGSTAMSCTYMLSFSPTAPGSATSLLLSTNVGNGGGDIVAYQDSAAHTTWYMVAQKNFYILDGTNGNVQGPFALTGPTGNLTGITQTLNGNLFAAEQPGSGTAWTLWRFATTAAAQTMTSIGTFTTGANALVNDLASVPAFYTITKTGGAQASPTDPVVYKVTLKNTGYATYPSLSIKDVVAGNLTVGSGAYAPTCVVTGGGTCATPTVAGQTIVANPVNLAPAANAVLTITGFPTSASGTASNTASGSVPFDPNQTNGGNSQNSNTITTTFVGTASMSKTVQNITAGEATPGTSDTGKPGDILEYVITFTNSRGVTLKSTGFTIADVAPTNTTYIVGSAACVSVPSGTTCTPPSAAATGPSLTWTLGGTDLATNAVVKIKFRATLN